MFPPGDLQNCRSRNVDKSNPQIHIGYHPKNAAQIHSNGTTYINIQQLQP